RGSRCQLLLGPAAAASGRAGRAAPAAGLGLGLGPAPALELLLAEAGEDDRDVAGALADARPATPGPRPPPLQRRPLVGEGAGDEQLVLGDVVVVLGVGNGRVEQLAHVVGDGALT